MKTTTSIQKKSQNDGALIQRQTASAGPNGAAIAPNHTGMPDALKSGIESLSGFSLDDVRVHTNSSKPAQLNALAYAQGQDIHLGPGQERHLPHEAWHVVQQAQGRVQPTMQMKGRVQINDDRGLEHEADIMGAKALQATASAPQVIQQKPMAAHNTGCGCAACHTQLVQKKASESVAQLTCDKGHKNHASGACPVKDLRAFNQKRAKQSHPQHGGDAKGRAKMYAKRKGQ